MAKVAEGLRPLTLSERKLMKPPQLSILKISAHDKTIFDPYPLPYG